MLNIGQRAGSTIAPVSSYTKRTKFLSLLYTTDVTLSASGATLSGQAVISSSIYFYSDSNNKWRMAGNIHFVFNEASSVTAIAATFVKSNLVFGPATTGSNQVNGGFGGNTLGVRGYCDANTNAMVLECASGITTAGAWLGFDVPLKQEPTDYTTAANMENVQNISAYFPPASAGVVGLVNNAVANTAGTPILGKTDGAAVAAGYVGQYLSAYGSAIGTNTTTYTNIATLTLPVGSWLVSAISYSDSVGVQNGAQHKMFVKGAAATTLGYDWLDNYNPAAGSASSVTFVTRVINIAAGDADKTVTIAQNSRTAAGIGFSTITAILIA